MQWGAPFLLISHDCCSGFTRIALAKDDTAIVFGEDVAFGGVFRCTMVSAYFLPSIKHTSQPITWQGLAEEFGGPSKLKA